FRTISGTAMRAVTGARQPHQTADSAATQLRGTGRSTGGARPIARTIQVTRSARHDGCGHAAEVALPCKAATFGVRFRKVSLTWRIQAHSHPRADEGGDHTKCGRLN